MSLCQTQPNTTNTAATTNPHHMSHHMLNQSHHRHMLNQMPHHMPHYMLQTHHAPLHICNSSGELLHASVAQDLLHALMRWLGHAVCSLSMSSMTGVITSSNTHRLCTRQHAVLRLSQTVPEHSLTVHASKRAHSLCTQDAVRALKARLTDATAALQISHSEALRLRTRVADLKAAVSSVSSC